jgi:hypothetical protein
MRPETQNSSSAKDSKTNPLSSISAIEKSLKSQDLGQDNPLSEISEGWSAVILKPEESQFTELLNRTFAVTADLMDSKLNEQ